MKKLFLLLLCVPLYVNANWGSSDKKTADETVEILTKNDEVMNAYLWLPEDYDPNMQYSAVVMAHGCGGAHYKDSPDQWTAKYVSGKYKVWGKLLNQNNIIALLVDSFSHRDINGDVGGGVCGGDPLTRPSKIDPITVRPADIASAVSWLKSRDDVNDSKIGVLGFSNGGTSALAFSNHRNLEARSQDLMDENKAWFELPYQEQYQVSTIISLYPGCGLNGYTEQSQNTIANLFKTNTDTYLFAASNDNSLPDDTIEKCHLLRQTDANHEPDKTNMLLKIVEGTGHQFDYYEEDEAPVQKTLTRILALFASM